MSKFIEAFLLTYSKGYLYSTLKWFLYWSVALPVPTISTVYATLSNLKVTNSPFLVSAFPGFLDSVINLLNWLESLLVRLEIGSGFRGFVDTNDHGDGYEIC